MLGAMLQKAAFVLALAWLLAGCRAPTPTPDSARDRTAILALLDAEGAAVVSQDIASLAALWAEDGVVTDAHHTPDDARDDAIWRGSDAILDRYVTLVFPGHPAFAKPADVQITINGNEATARATTHIGNEVSPAGDLWAFRRGAEGWVITSLTYNLEPE